MIGTGCGQFLAGGYDPERSQEGETSRSETRKCTQKDSNLRTWLRELGL
jgi:hypothetical protein